MVLRLIGVTKVKLWNLLRNCKYFMKCIFVLMQILVCTIMSGFCKSGTCHLIKSILTTIWNCVYHCCWSRPRYIGDRSGIGGIFDCKRLPWYRGTEFAGNPVNGTCEGKQFY